MVHIKYFDYVFYKIATSKFYQKVDPKMPYIWAFGVLQFCQLCNILTLVGIYDIFTGVNLASEPKTFVWKIAFPLSVFNVFFVMTEKKYKWLIERYKNEAHKKLKGWLVILYIVGTLVFAIVMGIFFSYKPF